MASLSSFSIFFLLLIFFALSIPAQSQKTQLSRRNLALTDQDQSQEQPTIPKPSTKKKKVAQADQQQEEEDQPILKSTSKKKKLASEQEQEEESIPKPTTKKKKPDPIEQEEGQEDQSISSSKSTTKKKKIDQEDDQSIPKSTTKKKKQDPIDQEEEPIPKPTIKKKKLAPIEQEDDQSNPKPTIKKKKLAPVEQQEDQANPKLTTKKKKLSPIDPEQDQPISKSTTENNKNSIFGSRNQTKTLKPKKSNSTSTSTQIPISSTPKSKPNKTQTLKPSNSTATTKPKSKPIDPIWLEEPDSDSDPDLIAEFRDLPTRIHEALLPDLKKISITSKAYIYKANKNIAENMKPFVGNKFAPKFALAFSCVFLVLPLCLVTFLFYHLNSYLSLQRFLIFVQAYLAIYFFTLSVTAVVTGLEPLRFFYATSPASYAWTQAVQTLGYLLYLLVQLIHLVVVFSAGESKVGVRVLGLVQMIVGLAVGGHYYAAVFHRAVTGEAPRANWKVHGVYAGCFLLICLCARAERGKKAYDGGEDGKKN